MTRKTRAMAEFFDTHAHLDYPDFAADFSEMLTRAQSAGITRMICIGTDLDSSRRAIQLAEAHPCLYAVAGWHPSNALSAPGDLRPALRELAAHPKVVAIGETGLDYFRLPSSQGQGTGADDERYKIRQAEVFVQQLEVAVEMGLNVVVHQRGDCFLDTLSLMRPWVGRVRGVFHCFAGDPPTLDQILSLDSIVSYTGIVTFKNGQNVRDSVAATPLGKFMLETDAPYLAPVPFRGKRCEPAHVKEIAATIAQVKNCSLEQLSVATCQAARDFFPKLPR